MLDLYTHTHTHTLYIYIYIKACLVALLVSLFTSIVLVIDSFFNKRPLDQLGLFNPVLEFQHIHSRAHNYFLHIYIYIYIR